METEGEAEAEAVVSVPETAPVIAEWEEPERPAVSRDRGHEDDGHNIIITRPRPPRRRTGTSLGSHPPPPPGLTMTTG